VLVHHPTGETTRWNEKAGWSRKPPRLTRPIQGNRPVLRLKLSACARPAM
jgi:hypothetical protein